MAQEALHGYLFMAREAHYSPFHRVLAFDILFYFGKIIRLAIWFKSVSHLPELQSLSPMLVEIVRRPSKEGAKPYGMAFRIVGCGVVLVQWDQF
mmetsp:Transcript_28528/g.73194  ORF Transcript_28528/g.73194 Transcript_28528/m.73194 type:complete len:94 (-) Transcript_28528:1490-1771(-)